MKNQVLNSFLTAPAMLFWLHMLPSFQPEGEKGLCECEVADISYNHFKAVYLITTISTFNVLSF
jgi:hypothetical protein